MVVKTSQEVAPFFPCFFGVPFPLGSMYFLRMAFRNRVYTMYGPQKCAQHAREPHVRAGALCGQSGSNKSRGEHAEHTFIMI